MPNTFLLKHRANRGAALTEYGILVGLVAVVAIGSIATFGGKVEATFSKVSSELSVQTASLPNEGGEDNAVSDAPVALASWSMTAAPRPSQTTQIGYGTGSYGDFGNVVMKAGDIQIALLFSQYDLERLFMELNGDHRDLISTHKLVCDDREWLISEASTASYSSGTGRTRFIWQPSTPFFQNGRDYNCALVSV